MKPSSNRPAGPRGISRRQFGKYSFGLLASAAVAGCDKGEPAPAPLGIPAGSRLVIPQQGLYTGAYIDFGEQEDAVTLEKIEEFEQLVGKQQAIVASSSYWGEQTFPDANMRLIARHGSIPLVYWSPWDRPYVEGRGPDKYSLTSILAGEHDAYIDKWGDSAREFGCPMIVSFANEANGSWFPWSGTLYGAGEPAPSGEPEHFKGPETYKSSFRYVVDRIRGRGAKNVQFVLHLMDFSDPNEHWNMPVQYFPGKEWCDWLGFSLYGDQFPGDAEWAPFLGLLEWPYEQLCKMDPNIPIMLCEWGVGELPQLGDKAEWFRDAFRYLQDPKYSRLKAIVYWHERWQNSDGENAGKYSNLRVNSSPASLEAYREGVKAPWFLSRPVISQ